MSRWYNCVTAPALFARFHLIKQLGFVGYYNIKTFVDWVKKSIHFNATTITFLKIANKGVAGAHLCLLYSQIKFLWLQSAWLLANITLFFPFGRLFRSPLWWIVFCIWTARKNRTSQRPNGLFCTSCFKNRVC